MKYPFVFLWKKVKEEIVDVDRMNEILKELHEKKYQEKPEKNLGDLINFIHRYSYIENERYIEVRYSPEYGVLKRYIVKKIFEEDDLKKSANISGMDAYNYVQELFQDNKKTDMTLYRAFSGANYREEYKMVKNCVPKQIGYLTIYNPCNIVKDKCFKADVSSAFPYQMTKSLPTFHGCIKSSGRLEPTEDYPFAFYVKSGHIKIYNELDTHDMKSEYYTFYKDVYNDSITEEEDFTILCPVSEYSLKEEFEYMYSQRKTDVNQKIYMNACIGFFHRNADPRLSLLAAVVIARNNNEMLKRVEQLEEENNGILYIATDCIIWRGKESSVATNDKYLGSFTYEGKNGAFYGVMVGSYQFLVNGELTTKCSYLKNDTDKTLIPFGKLPEPKNNLRFLTIGNAKTGRQIINFI